MDLLGTIFAISNGMKKHGLREAFLEDHQKLTKGLRELLSLVEAERFEDAARVAKELDTVAGAHIEFEEKRFYPEVEKVRGADYVDNLYDEHQSGVEAIRSLERLSGTKGVDAEERDRILRHLHRALDHVVSCGTLLSHVTALDEKAQAELLDALERYRSSGHRWTELERVRK
jgi:hypothetical protein